jgi:hypothetical protein
MHEIETSAEFIDWRVVKLENYSFFRQGLIRALNHVILYWALSFANTVYYYRGLVENNYTATKFRRYIILSTLLSQLAYRLQWYTVWLPRAQIAHIHYGGRCWCSQEFKVAGYNSELDVAWGEESMCGLEYMGDALAVSMGLELLCFFATLWGRVAVSAAFCPRDCSGSLARKEGWCIWGEGVGRSSVLVGILCIPKKMPFVVFRSNDKYIWANHSIENYRFINLLYYGIYLEVMLGILILNHIHDNLDTKSSSECLFLHK